ncbi:hypothetical protein D0469_19725 [Peribacillus saganii]|uniref:Uncharacterized protein n=1 Tax=Peribacillus saganii TaxID=2303992 RepID=A0A372LCB7_9BACI|nr:hypothetical protein [Peribacillus saganii]RFU63560.1 hypothetical protein D0469_19725 [Peribacillus saganii]
MSDQNQWINFNPDFAVQEKMEDIWRITCVSWEDCNENNVRSFLSKCDDENIDPQFCLNWIQQHKGKIPNAPLIIDTALNWVNEHTSTGSPISGSEQELQ